MQVVINGGPTVQVAQTNEQAIPQAPTSVQEAPCMRIASGTIQNNDTPSSLILLEARVAANNGRDTPAAQNQSQVPIAPTLQSLLKFDQPLIDHTLQRKIKILLLRP